MPETQSEWTEEDRVAAEAFLRRLETGGRKAPLNTLVALVFSLLIFCQGLYWMSTVKQAVEPGPTVLERLDAVPSDPSVPDILRVSGQSRKGLLLVQAEAQVRSYEAVLAAAGFTMFVIGTYGLVVVYSRRRDGRRDLIVAKLIRCYLKQMENSGGSTPP